MSFLYLGAPYTHPEEEVRQQRFRLINEGAARFLEQYPHRSLFSPITHGVPLEAHLPKQLGSSWDFWMRWCMGFLRKADEFFILPLPGWRESRGLCVEITFAKQLCIPISILRIPAMKGVCDQSAFQDCPYYVLSLD